MFVVFRPFVFHIRKSLKRGLRDKDSVCDASAVLLRERRPSIDKRLSRAQICWQCKVAVKPWLGGCKASTNRSSTLKTCHFCCGRIDAVTEHATGVGKVWPLK